LLLPALILCSPHRLLGHNFYSIIHVMKNNQSECQAYDV
jgi:hypothetical protein